MKLMSSIFILFLFVLSLCNKEADNFKSKGVILGPDLRDCACCGGWYITIDTTEYEFDNLPSDSGIDLQDESFPLKVRLDWKKTEKVPCPYARIDILRIEKEKL